MGVGLHTASRHLKTRAVNLMASSVASKPAAALCPSSPCESSQVWVPEPHLLDKQPGTSGPNAPSKTTPLLFCEVGR